MKNWIEHRRGLDGELLGWMNPVGDGFEVIDLLGRIVSPPVDWLVAETLLDELGIGYLASPFDLRLADGSWLRVRLVEVTPSSIRAKKDDYGDMTAAQVYYEVPFPVGDRLRTR